MRKEVKAVKDYAQEMIDQLQLLIDIADKEDYHIYGIGICSALKMDTDDLKVMIRKDSLIGGGEDEQSKMPGSIERRKGDHQRDGV